MAESYIQGSASYIFSGQVLKFEAAAGKKLYAIDGDNFFNLSDAAFTDTGITEKVAMELMLFDDGLNKISAKISSSLEQIPNRDHCSFRFDASLPFTFDFVYCELGFLP